MQPKQKAYLQLHLAVFLFGFTGILGKLISLDQTALVWNRLWIASLGLIVVPGVIKGIRMLSKKDILVFSGIGVIVASHWLTFYGSIKIGDNVSITLASLATASVFTSILEPLVTKSKFNPIELLLGVAVAYGVYLLFQVDGQFHLAIVVGLISAFLASIFSVLNKKHIAQHNSLSVGTIELFSGFLFISITYPISQHYLPQAAWFPVGYDWLWLLLLGIPCTSVAYALSIEALKRLSAFISTLSINLEPVYGIILAFWLLKEDQDLNANFYMGAGIILLAVFAHPLLMKLTKSSKE